MAIYLYRVSEERGRTLDLEPFPRVKRALQQLMFDRWYFFFKFPQFIPGIMIMIVTQVCSLYSHLLLLLESNGVLPIGSHHWI